MSDSEQQQIVPSLIDQQTIESIDQQTDKSDLTDAETTEADPAVQQITESDIIDNNSSNDTDDSGNKSPQQQQQQHEPMIQDFGLEDEIQEEQGPGQGYQVEEQAEGPTFVQQTAQHQIIPHLSGEQADNVVIKSVHYHRTLHYHVAPVYKGSVIKGDIIGSKAEVRSSHIGAVGGSQPPAIHGLAGQAALAWLGEGASGSSQVPAIGGPEQQQSALSWLDEGEGKGNQTAPNSETPEAFLRISSEPSSGRDANVASGARPKTTVSSSEPNLQISGGNFNQTTIMSTNTNYNSNSGSIQDEGQPQLMDCSEPIAHERNRHRLKEDFTGKPDKSEERRESDSFVAKYVKTKQYVHDVKNFKIYETEDGDSEDTLSEDEMSEQGIEEIRPKNETKRQKENSRGGRIDRGVKIDKLIADKVIIGVENLEIRRRVKKKRKHKTKNVQHDSGVEKDNEKQNEETKANNQGNKEQELNVNVNAPQMLDEEMDLC